MSITIKRIVTEPLVQFLISGLLLFLLVTYYQRESDQQAREITVDSRRVNLMIINYQSQMGVMPNKQQVDAMIDTYIKEEIAYREAKKMGLDKDDEIIRRRLSQKFDFMQTDLSDIPVPSDEVLQKFYATHPALFRTSATVSFSHIYFSPDNSSESIAKQRAFAVLQQVKQTQLKRAPEKGDRFFLQYDYTRQASVDIQQNFGDKPMLKELFKAPLNEWVGPFQSCYGWHLLYVSEIDSAAQIPFASNKEEVRAQYMAAEKDQQNKKIYDQLSEKYIINREYLPTK